MILMEDSILYRYSNRNKKKEEGMSNLFPMKKNKEKWVQLYIIGNLYSKMLEVEKAIEAKCQVFHLSLFMYI